MSTRNYEDYMQTDAPVFADLRALFDVEQVATVLDIGACEGEDSLRYARLFPRARVFAFEALPENQELVRAHFARHSDGRCELVPVALSAENGTATFHVSSGAPEDKPQGEDWDYGNKSSSLLPPGKVGRDWIPWLKFHRAITVPTRRLDDFCRERGLAAVDYMHIDVQGAEWLVLQGARDILPATRCIWMEVAETELYEGQRARSEVEAFLTAQGFRPVRRDTHDLESDVLYVNLRWPAGRRRWRAVRWKKFLGDVRMKLGRWRRLGRTWS